MRLFNNRFSVTSRLKAKKEAHSFLRDHFHHEVPPYDIDIDFLPRIDLHYYGVPGSCYWLLTLSWIVWDIRLQWQSNGLPKPRRKRGQQLINPK